MNIKEYLNEKEEEFKAGDKVFGSLHGEKTAATFVKKTGSGYVCYLGDVSLDDVKSKAKIIFPLFPGVEKR